jgi:hypothetical protein
VASGCSSFSANRSSASVAAGGRNLLHVLASQPGAEVVLKRCAGKPGRRDRYTYARDRSPTQWRLEVAMASLLLTRLDDVGWIAVGMPPRVPEGDPLSFVDGIVVVGILGLAFYCSFRLVTWLEVKFSALALFHDLRRELGIGGPRPSRGRRQGDRPRF